MPQPQTDYLRTAVWSDRLQDWTVVYLHPEANPDEGSFVLLNDVRQGPNGEQLPVAVYRPGRDGTHTPLGPVALEQAGLRDVPAGAGPPS